MAVFFQYYLAKIIRIRYMYLFIKIPDLDIQCIVVVRMENLKISKAQFSNTHILQYPTGSTSEKQPEKYGT